MLAWRGLSGSDDVLCAGLALSPFPCFLEMPYHWNGVCGVLQLYAEAEVQHVNHVQAALQHPQRPANRTEAMLATV